MISEAASESRSVNSALISIFPPPSGRVNVVGFSVGFSSSIPPLRTVHFRKKKFSAGVAVRVTVSPGMADAGLASAVPLPSSVTAVVYRFGSFVSSEQETAVSVHTVAA